MISKKEAINTPYKNETKALLSLSQAFNALGVSHTQFF